jgi:hypothetical protein
LQVVVVVQLVFCLRILWKDTERPQETSHDIPCPDQVSHHAFPIYKFKAFRLAYTTMFCESHSRSCKAESYSTNSHISLYSLHKCSEYIAIKTASVFTTLKLVCNCLVFAVTFQLSVYEQEKKHFAFFK